MKKTLLIYIVSLCVIAAMLADSVGKPGRELSLDYAIETLTVDSLVVADSAMMVTIAVYRDSVDQKMKEELCTSATTMTAVRPESGLMRLIADIMLKETQEWARKSGIPEPDFALFNSGGIRNNLPKGVVQLSDVFQVSPFENIAVIIEMDKATIEQVMEHIARRGGEAISGASFRLTGKKAKDILINGEPLEEGRTYHMATIDYLAEGGDSFVALVGHRQYSSGIIFHDMMADHLRKLDAQGLQLTEPTDIRIQSR